MDLTDQLKQHLVVASVAFICYLNTLDGGFVFDDTEAIIKNKDVGSNEWRNIFKNDFWGTDVSLNLSHKSYRPLTILSYRFNFYLGNGKLDPFLFHLTNVLLYVVLCSIVLRCFKLFDGPRSSTVSFDAALLYTVHPIHTEVVAALVGRADLLSSILFIGSILFYQRMLKRNSPATFLACVLLVGCAVLCKETAITALPFCCIYDIFYTKKLHGNAKWRLGLRDLAEVFVSKPFLVRLTGLTLSALLIIYLRLWVMNFEGPIFTKYDNPAAFAETLFSKIFSYNYIYFLNVLLLLWPEWLCFDWSMGCVPLITQFCDIRIIFVTFFWIIGLSFLLKIKYLSPSLIFALSMILLPFIPASNLFIRVGFVIAERTLLLPSAGFCYLIAHGVKKFRSEKVSFIFYTFCFLFATRTIQRNFEWLNEERLFTTALKVCPLNAKVHYNVAKVAADKNDKMLALREYNKAIELNSEYEQAMNNLANLLREDRKFKEAEVLLRRALNVRPNFAAAWMNLGIVLTNLNQTEEAEGCYLKAISFRTKYPDCYYNLGNLYLDSGRNEEALRSWEMAIKYRPAHTAAWSNTLVLLDSLGRFEETLRLSGIALMHNPKSPALHFCTANTLGKTQEFERAEKHFLEALNLSPENALYYSNLGVLYHRWGKAEKAKIFYRKALMFDPTMKTTLGNLRKLED